MKIGFLILGLMVSLNIFAPSAWSSSKIASNTASNKAEKKISKKKGFRCMGYVCSIEKEEEAPVQQLNKADPKLKQANPKRNLIISRIKQEVVREAYMARGNTSIDGNPLGDKDLVEIVSENTKGDKDLKDNNKDDQTHGQRVQDIPLNSFLSTALVENDSFVPIFPGPEYEFKPGDLVLESSLGYLDLGAEGCACKCGADGSGILSRILLTLTTCGSAASVGSAAGLETGISSKKNTIEMYFSVYEYLKEGKKIPIAAVPVRRSKTAFQGIAKIELFKVVHGTVYVAANENAEGFFKGIMKEAVEKLFSDDNIEKFPWKSFVKEVNERDEIVFDAGINHNIVKGQRFEIYSSGMRIATVEIKSVDESSSVATVHEWHSKKRMDEAVNELDDNKLSETQQLIKINDVVTVALVKN